MDQRQFELFLSTINKADGSKKPKQIIDSRGIKYRPQTLAIHKGNKQFIDRLQRMCLERGYRANVSVATKNRKNPCYVIYIKKQSKSRLGHLGIRPNDSTHTPWIIEDKNKVVGECCWCIEVENGTIVTSRNGKVAIVGNSVGRVQRVFPKKTQALVLDYVDSNIRYLGRMYKRRCTHYNKLKAVYE